MYARRETVEDKERRNTEVDRVPRSGTNLDGNSSKPHPAQNNETEVIQLRKQLELAKVNNAKLEHELKDIEGSWKLSGF